MEKIKHNVPPGPSELSVIRKACKGVAANGLADLENPVTPAPFQGRMAQPNSEGIVYAACDPGYFHRFARPFTVSILRYAPQMSVHLHLYQPDEAILRDVEYLTTLLPERFSASWEGGEDNPYDDASPLKFIYYATARFRRMAELAAVARSPIIALDVDTLFRGNPGAAFKALSPEAMGLIIGKPKKWWKPLKIWQRVKAGLVYAPPTEAAARFLKEAAAVMDCQLASAPNYHVDQTVLYFMRKYCARYGRAPGFQSLPSSLLDWTFSSDGVIWTAKGSDRKSSSAFLSEIDGLAAWAREREMPFADRLISPAA